MKKIFYVLFGMAIVCLFTNLPNDMVFAKTIEQSQEQQMDMGIDTIEIVPKRITKTHSWYDRLTNGSSMVFEIKVCTKDGVQLTGEQANVQCELRTKNGAQPHAVCTVLNSKDECANIGIYAPYGYEEELKLVAWSAYNESITATHEFKTVLDQRDGTSFFRFVFGTTTGKVKCEEVKENWNVEDKTYCITLPKVTAKEKADRFVGWKDEEGKVHSAGQIITVKKTDAYCPMEAVWKTSKGSEFSEKVDKATLKYAVTGKDTVALVNCTSIIKGAFELEIPETVEYHNHVYKVDTIAKSALAKVSLSKIIIGKNVTKIQKGKFGQLNFLKTIVIRSKKLSAVSKNAMKGISKSVTILCPKTKVKGYTKLLRTAGLDKRVKIKSF